MKKYLVSFLGLCFGLCFAAGNALAAGAAPTSKPVVSKTFRSIPASTRVLFSLSELGGLEKAFKTTPLWKLLQEPEAKAFVTYLMERYFGLSQHQRYRRPLRYRRSRRSRRSRRHRRFVSNENWLSKAEKVFKKLTGSSFSKAASIYNGSHSLVLLNTPVGSSPPKIGVILEFGDKEKANKLLESLFKQLPFAKRSFEYKGFQIKGIQSLENSLYYTTFKNKHLLGTTKETIKELIDTSLGKSPSLRDNKDFQVFLKKSEYRDGMLLFISSGRLSKDLLAIESRGQFRALRLLGLMQFKNLGLVSSIKDSLFSNQFFTQTTKDAVAISDLTRLSALSPRLFDFVSENTIGAHFIRAPLVRIWENAWKNYIKLKPRRAQAEKRNLERFEKGFLTFQIRELLEVLGEEIGLYVSKYPHGGLLPQVMLAFRSKDMKRLQKMLKRVGLLMGYELGSELYQKKKILSFKRNDRATLPLFRRHFMFEMLVKARFVVHKEMLFVSNTQERMKDLIDQLQSVRSAKTIAFQKKLLRKSKGAGLYVYWDFRSVLGGFYNTYQVVRTFSMSTFLLRMARIPRFRKGIPRFKVLWKHMRPMDLTLRSEKSGSLLAIKTAWGVDLMLLSNVVGTLIRRSFFQRPFGTYIDDFYRLIQLQEKARVFELKGQFYLGFLEWKKLESGAKLETVIETAKKQRIFFKKKYDAHRAKIAKKLSSMHRSQKLGEWDIVGDWQLVAGVLSVNSDIPAAISFRGSYMESYALSFEVFQPTKGMSVGTHIQSSRNVLLRQKKHTIFFSRRKFPKERWLPIRVKVKKKRVSYWFQFKHRSLRTFLQSGKVGFFVPAGGSFLVKNIQFRIPLQAMRKAKTKNLPYPSIQLSLRQDAPSIKKGELQTYRIHLKNRGGQAASNLQVEVVFSKEFGSKRPQGCSGQSGLISCNKWKWNSQTRTLTSPSISSFRAMQKAVYAIGSKPVEAGAGSVQVSVRFKQLKGEIFTEAFTHVVK